MILVQAMYNEQMARLWVVILICGVLGGGLYGLMRRSSGGM